MWQKDILVLPDELIAFAWSAPMRDLAAKLELSDVGLKKLLTRCGIASPPQGYWNKIRAGKKVPAIPKASPRRPGGLGRVSVDARFAKVLAIAAPLASDGPFASALVPENLDELYAQELQAIGKVSVSQSMDRPHKGLVQMLKREQRRRDKNAEREWTWDEPKFDTPLGKRRLRILNALFVVLSKRGYDGDAYEHDGEIHARAIISDTALGLDIQIVGSHRTVLRQGYMRPAPDLPASTPLALRLDADFDRKNLVSWQDDNESKLESKIAQIAATIIMTGEKKFRLRLREAEERAERERIEEEKRRQERLVQLNKQRLQNLHTSGELLRQAQDIRALVERVEQAINDGSAPIHASTLKAWREWALSEADRLDPVQSGQILTHLEEPLL